MNGFKYLSVGSDAKTVKGEKQGYLTGILYLSPAQEASKRNLCPFASDGCKAACLYTAGRGIMKSVMDARLRRTHAFLNDSTQFVSDLKADIARLSEMATKKGMRFAVRLNGTTDIPWERFGIMQELPKVQFYDYTKYPVQSRRDLPENYHLTFSLSEKPESEAQASQWIDSGRNVAVVFAGELPNEYPINGRMLKVVDGDQSDLRFNDESGVIVGLKAKGKARGSSSGFVRVASTTGIKYGVS